MFKPDPITSRMSKFRRWAKEQNDTAHETPSHILSGLLALNPPIGRSTALLRRLPDVGSANRAPGWIQARRIKYSLSLSCNAFHPGDGAIVGDYHYGGHQRDRHTDWYFATSYLRPSPVAYVCVRRGERNIAAENMASRQCLCI